MSGLDGALLDEFTQGINAPANGQQGYFTFADGQAPRPNLEYKSPADTAAILKPLVAQVAEAKSLAGATIAASGTAVLTYTFPPTPHAVREYWLRCVVRVGGTTQYAARVRCCFTTSASGLIVTSSNAVEFTIGSGFSLSANASAGASTVGLTITSSTGSIANYSASIFEIYSDAIA